MSLTVEAGSLRPSSETEPCLLDSLTLHLNLIISISLSQ